MNRDDPKKQKVAVSVLEFEPTQAIIGIFEWFRKLKIARRELCRRRVRMGDMQVGVPVVDALFEFSCAFGTGSTPTALSMIIAARRTMPNKMSSGSGP
jgi:hypothetical protein